MSEGHIEFDSATAQAMTDTGAKIYMFGLDFDSTPNIVVKMMREQLFLARE